MSKAFIVAAKRTPVGKFGGGLSTFSAAELAAGVIKNILQETKVDPSKIDEVMVGNVLPAGQGQGVARQAAIKGGVPVEVPAMSINMVCGSGMKTIITAVNAIKAGEADLILAGGTESMSNAPYLLPANLRNGNKMGHFQTTDHMIADGLWDAFNDYHMGITAENIADKYQLKREEQDAFSYKSQQRAAKAIDEGKFKDEIVPMEVVTRRETVTVDTDEYVNRTTNPEKLAGLRGAFKKDGMVTAGNASGINDGASFVLVASEKAVKEHGLTPLAEIVSTGQGGVDPSIMGMGPVPAIRQALNKAGLKLSDMDVVELNEAFAAQSLGVAKQLGEDHGIDDAWVDTHVNRNGGAIAIGHPIGASGNRIVVSLIHEMKRSNARYGLASLCIGGGMGTAVILKKAE